MNELYDLIDGYAAGHLTPDEEARLADLLEDPGARDIFVQQITLVATIRGVSAVSASARQVARRPSYSEAVRFGVPMAVAAGVLVAVGIWWSRGAGAKSAGSTVAEAMRGRQVVVAKVVEQKAEVRGQNSDGKWVKLRVGDEIRAGMRIQTTEGGLVKFDYVGEATRVEVGKLSIISCQSSVAGGKQINLQIGSLSASVAKQAAGKPLVVTTSRAKMDVLGTRFLASDDGQVTRLHVREGKVRMTQVSDSRSIEVNPNYSALAGRGIEFKPIASGTEYVDGPIQGTEDFENEVSRDNSETYVEQKTLGDKRSKWLVLREGGIWTGASCSLPFVIEYDLWVQNDAWLTCGILDKGRGVSQFELKPDAGQPERCLRVREEFLPKSTQDGKRGVERRVFCDGKRWKVLQFEGGVGDKRVSVFMVAKKGEVGIDNYVARSLVRVREP